MREAIEQLDYPQQAYEAAREFVQAPLNYSFSRVEREALQLFFTNLDSRVFFMQLLPANVGATLLAMFSRLKNPRGLRGVFVDTFLPQFLATQLPEVEKCFGGSETRFLQECGLTTLDRFLGYSVSCEQLFGRFTKALSIDPEYFAVYAESKKARKFLQVWLDKYGHNSIARMGNLWLCFEQISVLAAKSLEWSRPGAGFIELSTRYVDMSAKGCYPVAELAAWGVPNELTRGLFERSFTFYNTLLGEKVNGIVANFLREQYGQLFDSKNLEVGVFGECCDVLGNLLPAAALTSLGVNVSGEALPVMLQHLALDATPENIALIELVLTEGEKVGAGQFLGHWQPTRWGWRNWQYRSLDAMYTMELLSVVDVKNAELTLQKLLNGHGPFAQFIGEWACGVERGGYDKLPAEFETVSLTFRGKMSFRGWRDLQRMSFCAHRRTLLSPDLGFYVYDKPAPPELGRCFRQLHLENQQLQQKLQSANVPALLQQYVYALGNLVGFTLTANLRQLEFCNWQRSKWTVNHEVRQTFLAIEHELRDLFEWWLLLSRADVTPSYIFARGEKALPLVKE